MATTSKPWPRGLLILAAACAMGLLMVVSSTKLLNPALALALATAKTETMRLEVDHNSDKHTKVPSWQGFQPNRSLALIHIGKASGLSLRAMTSLNCRLPRDEVTDESIRICLLDTFGSIDPSTQPLVLQTIYYAHMNSIPHQELEQATSWILTLRNPVERVISAWRYSHPANCRDAVLLPNSTKGCTNQYILREGALSTRKKNWMQVKTERQLSKVFVECFPHGNVEQLTQIATQPNNSDDGECSRLARSYITGKGPLFPIPHLAYNYQHYWTKALEPHDTPGKEWLGVRTEHLWDDFQALNNRIGGAGDTEKTDLLEPIKLSHGSEHFQSSASISPASYQQLCCLLRDEISVYMEMLKRVWNLNNVEKHQTLQNFAQKCGFASPSPGRQPAEEAVHWQIAGTVWERWLNSTCLVFES